MDETARHSSFRRLRRPDCREFTTLLGGAARRPGKRHWADSNPAAQQSSAGPMCAILRSEALALALVSPVNRYRIDAGPLRFKCLIGLAVPPRTEHRKKCSVNDRPPSAMAHCAALDLTESIRPPSTVSTCAVIQPHSDEARNTTALAMPQVHRCGPSSLVRRSVPPWVALRHVGADEAWRHGVHGDAVLAQLQGKAPRWNLLPRPSLPRRMHCQTVRCRSPPSRPD